MSQRSDWVFSFSAAELVAAIKVEVEYRERRIAFWEAEKEKADQAIRESPVKIKELEVTGGVRVERTIELDTRLEDRASECHLKIKAHKDGLEYYRRWLRLFEKESPDRIFNLNIDDVDYFRLVYSRHEEQEFT